MEDIQKEEIITLRGGEVSSFIAPLMTKIAIPLTIIFIIAIIQLFRLGFGQRYLILLSGSILSGISIFGEIILIIWDSSAGKKHRGILPMLLSFIGFLPYIFGCYLVFYEGFWSLRTIPSNFSITTIIYAFIFIFTGYKIVYGCYLFSEFERKVNKGIILIDPKSQT